MTDAAAAKKAAVREVYLSQMQNFWQKKLEDIQTMDFKKVKHHELPLARVKKIMKSDPDVKMISAEAPVLFAKACELFILDLTMRAWTKAEENDRKTLTRGDVADAVTESDLFDFLSDIVPREEGAAATAAAAGTGTAAATTPATAATAPAAAAAAKRKSAAGANPKLNRKRRSKQHASDDDDED